MFRPPVTGWTWLAGNQPCLFAAVSPYSQPDSSPAMPTCLSRACCPPLEDEVPRLNWIIGLEGTTDGADFELGAGAVRRGSGAGIAWASFTGEEDSDPSPVVVSDPPGLLTGSHFGAADSALGGVRRFLSRWRV